MALTSASITAALQAAAPEAKGPTFVALTSAIGVAVYAWAILPVNLALTGITSGVAGSGVVNGLITVPPNPASAVGIFASNGVAGPTGIIVARAIGVGIPTIFTSFAQYTGLSIGVSAGTDVSKIAIVNPGTLTPLLLAQMQATFGGSIGPSAVQTATAVSLAITSLLVAGFTTPGTGIVIPTVTVTGPGLGTSPLSTVF